jgi:hypothetical protein
MIRCEQRDGVGDSDTFAMPHDIDKRIRGVEPARGRVDLQFAHGRAVVEKLSL